MSRQKEFSIRLDEGVFHSQGVFCPSRRKDPSTWAPRIQLICYQIAMSSHPNTHSRNANAHPGLVDISSGSTPKRKYRTKSEKDADNKRKREEAEDKATRKVATMLTLAKMEREQKALEEEEMAHAALPPRSSQIRKGLARVMYSDPTDEGDQSLEEGSSGRKVTKGVHSIQDKKADGADLDVGGEDDEIQLVSTFSFTVI